MKRSLSLPLLLCLSAALFAGGCSWMPWYDGSYRYVHPRVAVFKFENKAPFPQKWELGEGMSDMLVARLMKTNRFTVLEREDINTVLSEINLQQSEYTRPQGRVRKQNLKNVQYLIKGVITDFAHVAQGGIGIGYRWLRIGGGGKIALVSMVVTVIDVESGEVILSETCRGFTYCGSLDTEGIYKGVAFGGQMFFKMPLGHATNKAMKKAVKRIVEAIGEENWRPMILAVEQGRIVLNGGENRKVERGDIYYVMRPGKDVVDSETGNFLGRSPGREIGAIEITDVFPQFSYARLREGAAGREGYRVRPLSSEERNALIERAERMRATANPAPAQ